MIKAVLFDMDGVLLDTERLYLQILLDILREHGYEMDTAFFIRTLGVPNRECRQLYTDVYGDDFPYEAVLRRLFLDVQAHIQKHGTPLKSGVKDCMRALKARGLKLVLATSCPRYAVENYLRTLPELALLLDGSVCGDEVSQGKPHPEIFIKAAAIAGQEPAACLGAEDSASGLRAIRASGAYSVMIPDLLPYSRELAPFTDIVLKNITELPPLIDKLNA
ncbi:MAG: HAD family phosphatase [Bacillota bacterium]